MDAHRVHLVEVDETDDGSQVKEAVHRLDVDPDHERDRQDQFNVVPGTRMTDVSELISERLPGGAVCHRRLPAVLDAELDDTIIIICITSNLKCTAKVNQFWSP